MNTRVGERGQVTIPKAIRERLGIRAGQTLEVREEKGRVVLVKGDERSPIEAAFGILKLKKRTDALMEELRGPTDGL